MTVRSSTRLLIKNVMRGFSLIVVFPFAVMAGFGRFAAVFQTCAQLLALLPGLPGDFLRAAYYFLTLREFSLNSKVCFGSFFAQSTCCVAEGVYIGAYSVIGACEIGERTQIASHVQVLSGKHQHGRNAQGQLLGAEEQTFNPVVIGSDCWIGAAAIIMADIGAQTTIGAASVVTRPIPTGVVAVGNPARLLDRAAK